MQAIEFVAGVLLLVLVLWDVFQTVVVPRPSPGWFRLGRYVVRGSWRVVRAFGRDDLGTRHSQLLGLFAPAMTIMLLVTWLTGLILGYGLILHALRDEMTPSPEDLGTAIYFAASSVLTLGYGDIVANGTLARFVVIAAAATGLGIVALVVTFLFSLYASYQRREIPSRAAAGQGRRSTVGRRPAREPRPDGRQRPAAGVLQ